METQLAVTPEQFKRIFFGPWELPPEQDRPRVTARPVLALGENQEEED